MANPTDAGTYHVVASLEHPNHEADNTTGTVHIRPLGITGSFTADDKTYDANTGAEVLGRSLHGVIGDDDASLVGGSASFEDKNVGADKVVSLSGASLDGDHAKNYSLSGVRDAAADIEARPITITADAKSKPYGTPDPALTYNLTGGTLVGADALSGALGRDAGEAAGQYDILLGTVKVSDGNGGDNYDIDYVGAKLTINASWYARGFYAPVGTDSSVVQAPNGPLPAVGATSVWNSAKGGSTVPLKFNAYESEGGTEKTDLASVKGFEAKQLASCTAGASEDLVDFVTTGSSGLRYDATAGQFVQNWKTPAVSKDTCYRASVTMADGTAIHAFFKLRK